MPLKYLDHVNVKTTRLDQMRAFYRDVMGMREGPRPPFSFGGAWMYLQDRPVVHLVEVESVRVPGEPSLEHFAFAADDLAAFLGTLAAANIAYRVGEPPEAGIKQVHLADPEGNHLHVDFLASERL